MTTNELNIEMNDRERGFGECCLQHEERVGDRAVVSTEGEPLIEEAAAAQTREEGDLPETSPAEGVWSR